jgi:hypothetical protein
MLIVERNNDDTKMVGTILSMWIKEEEKVILGGLLGPLCLLLHPGCYRLLLQCLVLSSF